MNIRIGKGTLTTSLVNIDANAVPVDRYTMLKAITLCNKTDTDCWVTIQLDGSNLLYKYVVPGFGEREENTRTIPFVDQIMVAGDRLTGAAQANDAIDFCISGYEVDVS